MTDTEEEKKRKRRNLSLRAHVWAGELAAFGFTRTQPASIRVLLLELSEALKETPPKSQPKVSGEPK